MIDDIDLHKAFVEQVVPNCSCEAIPSLRIKHALTGLLMLLVRIVIFSILMALLLSVIDMAYNVGSIDPISALPFSALGQKQAVALQKLDTGIVGPVIAKNINDALLIFNQAFPRYTRYGSGIGTILACFWSLHVVPYNCKLQRGLLGIIAGGIAGFRLVLLLQSSPGKVVVGFIVGSICGFVFMRLFNLRANEKKLPICSP